MGTHSYFRISEDIFLQTSVQLVEITLASTNLTIIYS